MPYVSGFDRDQLMCCSWDAFVDKESIARIIDAFVNHLDIGKYGVKPVAAEGRPSYDPKSLYKIYIYGSRKGIRSSRKLAESCKVNLEVKWMIGGVEPDFRTIADFRKNNIDSLKEIFYEFNRRISGAVEWGFSSVDGTKIQADNAKDNNFTKNKLDDRIKWLNGHTDEYLRILNEMDKQEETDVISGELTRESLEAKLKEAQERLARYEGYQKLMEETGVSQLSITDADAKLMKNKNGFTVAYNPQTAVDSETHLIRDFQMTNQVTDHGLLESTMQGIKSSEPEKIIEVVADKGYEAVEDMVEVHYNSGQYTETLREMEQHWASPYAMFEALADYYERLGYTGIAINRLTRYEILFGFLQETEPEKTERYRDLLTYDLYLRENIKSRPAFLRDESPWKTLRREFFQGEEKEPKYLKGYEGYDSRQMAKMAHLEVFGDGRVVVFDYKNRDPLTYNAKAFLIAANPA